MTPQEIYIWSNGEKYGRTVCSTRQSLTAERHDLLELIALAKRYPLSYPWLHAHSARVLIAPLQ